MPLINCEFNLILTCSATCFIIDAPIANHIPTFTITDTKLYVPVVTLSTQDNEKLLQELKSGSKRIINWKKCELKVIVEQQNQYFDFLINPSFQGVNRFFVLSFENNGGRTSYTRYYLPLGEIKDYNVMIDGQHFCNQPAKNYLITYENIWKIENGQGDDYKMIAIGLSEQQALDADPKAIQKINFTVNLNWDGNKTMFFITEKAKETILDSSQGTVKTL